MAYVIAEPCIGTKDNSCVEVCPVDCIHPTPDEPGYDQAEMLYIDPEECIDCDACVEACPVDAIHEWHLLAALAASVLDSTVQVPRRAAALIDRSPIVPLSGYANKRLARLGRRLL